MELHREGSGLGDLPEALVESILVRTLPKDVARLACVSPTFFAASKSNWVWKKMLPTSVLTWARCHPYGTRSSKQLYDFLSDEAAVICEGNMEIWLDKATGGICRAIPNKAITSFWDMGYISQQAGSLECFLSRGTYTVSWRLRPRFRPQFIGANPWQFSLEATGNAQVQTEYDLITTEGTRTTSIEALQGQQQTFVCRSDLEGYMELEVGQFVVASEDSKTTVEVCMLETEAAFSDFALFGHNIGEKIIIRPSFVKRAYETTIRV